MESSQCVSELALQDSSGMQLFSSSIVSTSQSQVDFFTELARPLTESSLCYESLSSSPVTEHQHRYDAKNLPQIFSHVSATLADYILKMIPDSVETLIEQLQLTTDIHQGEKNCMSCTIHGDLGQILEVQRSLEKYLSTAISDATLPPAAEISKTPPDNSQVSYEKSVMCDVAATEKPSAVTTDQPRRTSARLLSLHKGRSTSPAAKIKEKYKAQRKVKRTRKLDGSSTRERNRKARSPLRKTFQFIKSRQQIQCRPLCSSGNQAVDEENSEEDAGPKRPKKNYEELTPYKFFCDTCSFKTKRESHYQKHLAIHKKVNTLHKCDKCAFTAIRLTHLRRHEMTHSQTMFKCSLCSYKTDEQKLLTRHVKLKHERGTEMQPAEVIHCAQCMYKTTKPFRFQRHQRVHDGGHKGIVHIYQCDQCTYKTNRKEHYIRHVNNVHINKRPYLCDFCGKAFKRPDALKQHRVTHVDTETRATHYMCPVCQKGCRSQAHLNEHQAVHSNVRAFLCELCGASFKTRSVQRKHMLTIHKNPRSHECEHCLKRFNTSYALRRHLRLHLSGGEDITESIALETTPEHLQLPQPQQEPSQSRLPSAAASSHMHVNAPPNASFIAKDQIIGISASQALRSHLMTTAATTIPITISTNQSTLHHLNASTTIQLQESLGAGNGETTTIIPLSDTFDPTVAQTSQPFIQASEATTALLYLTTNYI